VFCLVLFAYTMRIWCMCACVSVDVRAPYILRGCCKVLCIVLQCAAFCFSLWQSVAVCCSVLQSVAVCCSLVQSFAVCCSVLQCVDVRAPSTRGRWFKSAGVALQCVAVCCSVLQCVAVCCSVLQCVAVCCSGAPINEGAPQAKIQSACSLL